MSIRVVVCGGRTYENEAAVTRTLDALHDAHTIGCVITGGAPGADELAWAWARKMAIPASVYFPDWRKYGRAAGPIRNRRMLDEGRPDLVVAFPGGDGTQSTVDMARARGLDVLEVDRALERR